MPTRVAFEFVLDELQPLPTRTNPLGSDGPSGVGGRMSFTKRVPPTVPSVSQSSVPVAPSFAAK